MNITRQQLSEWTLMAKEIFLGVDTPAEAAEILRCSADHVRALSASGRLAATNISLGNRRAKWIISANAIDMLLTPPTPPTRRKQPPPTTKKWI